MYEVFFEDRVFIMDVRYSWFDCLNDSSNYALSIAVIIVTQAYHGRWHTNANYYIYPNFMTRD